MYSVILVDDDKLVRVGLRNALDWSSLGLSIVGEASDGGEALLLMEQMHPDIVVTDMYMPRYDGLRFIEEAKKLFPQTVFVVISCHNDLQYIKQSFKLGVYDYLLKSSIVDTDELSVLLNNIVEMLDNRSHSGLVHDSTRQETAERLVLSYLQGHIDTGHSLELRLRLEGIDHRHPDHFLVAVRFNEIRSMLPSTDRLELQDGAKGLVESLISEYGVGVAFSYNRDILIALMCVNRTVSAISPKDKALSVCELMRIYIKDNLKATCCVYLTEGMYFEELPNAFDDLLCEVELVHDYYFDTVVDLSAGVDDNWSEVEFPEDGSDPVAKALNYIHQNYQHPITLDDLAREANLSKYHLCKRFKDKTKTTIINYILQMRIDRAKALIMESEFKISEVASQVGFNDASYFSRLFKRETGHSPTEYSEFMKQIL